ncbi:hypothetical protein MycrhDRAFT_4599 [Mycolicibacterium rhodesiae JS60]|nr:hypothetical protein MycrhDRAFT_4599 [Mycolicibacterium rhodesiae JS60]
MVLPFVILWDAPGEKRTRLDKAAELTVFAVWTRLIRSDLALESRIRCLWLAFAGCAILMSSTAVYFLAELGAGFADIGQGAFDLCFKFIGENVPFIVLPPLVLYSIHPQIDHLTRRAARAKVDVSWREPGRHRSADSSSHRFGRSRSVPPRCR